MQYPFNNPMFGQSNVYQQMLQQYQQNMIQPQQGVTIFTNVPSEEVARRSDVPPNTTRNFINENEGYVYLKSVGMSNRSMANNRMYNRTRTSYNNSYGNDAKMDFMAEVESLVNRAPDEHTRMKIERMLNDLR